MNQWTDKTVSVTGEDGESQADVQARTFGAFAVHKAVANDVDPEWFTLTHVPTGRSVMHLADEAQLILAGEWLWARHCMTFRLKDREQIVAKTASWVKPWQDLCMAEGKFLVPQS